MSNASPGVKQVTITAIAVFMSMLLPVSAQDVTKVEEPAPVVATSVAPGPQTQIKEKPTLKKTRHTTSVDCEKYRDLIIQYDWPVDVAMQICKDESRGNPLAVNLHDLHYADASHKRLICIGSTGLFQIACFWPTELGYTREDAKDPVSNIAMAYKIWRKYGWSQWSTYRG